jgi:aryl-alcohol dehydrogenase-like predicted oxidoreductase
MTGVIAGSRNPEHVAENATAGSLKVDAETLAEIGTAAPAFVGLS